MLTVVSLRAQAAKTEEAGAPSALWWGPNDGLPSSVVTGMVQTNDGFLWLGTLDGVARFDGVKFNAYMPQVFAGSRSARVRCFIPSSTGGAWIVMDRGPIIRLERGKLPSVVNEGLNEIATSAVEDRNGALWIGYQHLPAQRLVNGKLTAVPVPNAPAGGDSVVAIDASGILWFGQSGLVARQENGEIKQLYKFSNLTMAMAPAVDGGVWVYCENRLLKLDKNGGARDCGSPPVTLAHISATALSVDHSGTVWLSVWRGGLLTYDGSGYQMVSNVGSAHPLGMSEDSQGNTWIRTQGEGILRLRPVGQRSVSPPPVVERVTVDEVVEAEYGGLLPTGKATDLSVQDAALKLPPENVKVQFDFTAPDFAAPDAVRFRYKLEGFDKDWIDSAKSRSAVYSRLPAGDYSFRVESTVNGKEWHEGRPTVAITVWPFYWQRWWFWPAVSAGFLAIVAGVRYLSIRRLRRQLHETEQAAALERERSRIAKDLHDDLGGTLTHVSLLLELAQRNPERAMDRIQQMYGTMKQVNESLDEIVWAVNPRNDTLPHLINYLGQFALEFLNAAAIRCRVDLPENPPNRPVSPEMRHNLFLMVKEALNNIVRHARATEVWFRLRVRDDAMEVSIEDNGAGLNGAAAHSDGNGLGNMRHRVEEIGGRFNIESESGAGTRISADLPWPTQILGK
jgi:signal transduction histidine kinase